jgi:N-acyl-D-aspartate/D-glutamate deacylase
MTTQMDLVIRSGTVVDGSGAPAFRGDVGVKDGRIVAVGGRLGAAKREIDADGALVTPGFVDVHTHYDGQATWDPMLSPSSWHGVTTAVMGNCGVGFAPVRHDRHEWLISVMEGVEDIPGTVLAEGIQWDWESFPEYLDALERRPHALDVGAQIPHSALRTYVMGDRGVSHDDATGADIEAMATLVREGLRAGALGFSTSRTLIHHYAGRKFPPGTFASADELFGIGRAMKEVGHGVFQMTSNHVQMDGEVTQWLTRFARETGRPVSFALVQTDQTADLWKTLITRLDDALAQGVPLIGAISARPAGILMCWQGSIQPFSAHPLWRELAALPWPERLARLKTPEVRAALVGGMQQALDGPMRNDSRAMALMQGFHKMFALVPEPGAEPDYEPLPERSVKAIAQREGRVPLDVVYDLLMADEGTGIVYFPSFNFANGDLDHARVLMQHPQTMMSLADGGAHCGYICDASMPTFMLTHWARGRARTRGPDAVLPLELMVKRQTSDTARVYGLLDRGLIREGMKADLNVIDFERLALRPPRVVFDLPAGGRRLVQEADGYVATIVSGEPIRAHGQDTGALPGQLLRGPRSG